MTSAILKRFSLRLRRQRPPDSGLPLGLDPDQVEALHHWGQTPAGRAWAQALERLFDLQAEQLAGRLVHDEYLFQCGVIHALRVVSALPDTLTQALEAHRARVARRNRSTDDALDRTHGFLNTPWFERGGTATHP